MEPTPTASTDGTTDPDEDARPEAYFWAEGDEIRRAFIIDVMSCADISGAVLVENMDAVFQWLKSGKLPSKKKAIHAVHRGDVKVEGGEAS